MSKMCALIYFNSTRLFAMEEEIVLDQTGASVNWATLGDNVNILIVLEDWTFIRSSVQLTVYVLDLTCVNVTRALQVRIVSIQFAMVLFPMKPMFVTNMADVSHRTLANVIMHIMDLNAKIRVALVSRILTLRCVPLMVCAMDLTSATVQLVGFRGTAAFQHVSASGEQIIPCAQNMVFVSNLTFVFVAQVEQVTIVS